MIHRIRRGKFPHKEFNPYPNFGEPSGEKILTSLYNGFEPKRRFIPSKHEAKRVLRMVNAIRNGWILSDEQIKQREEEKDRPYLIWGV